MHVLMFRINKIYTDLHTFSIVESEICMEIMSPQNKQYYLYNGGIFTSATSSAAAADQKKKQSQA